MSVIRQLSLLIAMTGTALGAQAATAARSVAGKAKAESDGQDLLTPLVERASEGVAAAVLKAPR